MTLSHKAAYVQRIRASSPGWTNLHVINLRDELGIRLDPLLLSHDRQVGERVVWADECSGDRILDP